MEPKQQNYAFKSSFRNQPVLAPEQQSHGFTSSNCHLSSQNEPTMLDISAKATESLAKSQKFEPVSSSPNPSFPIPQISHPSQLQPGIELLKVNQKLTNCPSKGFSDYWLSTTKTQPMKYTRKGLQPYNNLKTSLPSTSSQGKLFRGVRQRHGEKWVAETRLPGNRTRVWLGSFDTAEEAAFAYDTAAYILRGDYAHLNFPDLKHQLKTNSASGATAALLEAKLQAMSTKKAVDLQPTSSKEVLSSENSTSRSESGYKLENRVGSEIIIENNKKSPDMFLVPDASSSHCTMEPKQQNYAFKSSFRNQPVLALEQESHGFTSSNRHLSSQK